RFEYDRAFQKNFRAQQSSHTCREALRKARSRDRSSILEKRQCLHLTSRFQDRLATREIDRALGDWCQSAFVPSLELNPDSRARLRSNARPDEPGCFRINRSAATSVSRDRLQRES